MGFELTRFIGEIDKEYQCSICRLVLKEPMQSPCDHLFCNECIHLWLEVDDKCPEEDVLLNADDLKPPAKFISNLLDKLDIKCDFQQKGCKEVVKLGQLKDHVAICEYSLNTEMTCDKGCNMKITRRDYQMNCFTHLANRMRCYEDENKKLSYEVHRQNGEITKLSDEVGQQRMQIAELKENRHRLNISSNSEISSMPQKWRKIGNIKIRGPILQVDDLSRPAVAKSFYSLKPTNHSFKITIVKLDCILIGLTNENDSLPGSEPGFIYYYSNGKAIKSGCDAVGPAPPEWKVGDVIECGVIFEDIFIDDGKLCVYLSIDGQLKTTKRVQMPQGGFFPMIRMYGNSVVKFTMNK